MASMSYCMFENTSLEMRQVVNAMREADSIEELGLSQYEMDGFEQLYTLCKRYIKEYDRLAESEEDFEEDE